MLRSKLIPRKLNRNYFAIFLFLIVVFLTLNTAALTEEKNTWIAHSALVVTKSETLKVNDNENHFVFFTEYDGVVFNDNGEGSFLDKARYQVVYLGDTAGMVDGGYKIFTMPDGSQVFAKYQGTAAAPPVFNGKWEFIGGTRKYKGITGKGVFTLTTTSEKTSFDILKGEYKLP